MSTLGPDGGPTPAAHYRKLIRALASRAARMGSLDPEAAAQEAIRRSLANAASRPALEYYFRDQTLAAAPPPAWPLAQLLGWLHGVLRFVVREERARARARSETAAPDDQLSSYRDPSPDQLQNAIDAQSRAIVHECVMQLNDDHRAAWLLRLQGARYDEIARRLGVNENTVATWLRRGSQELIRRVQEQIDPRGAAAHAAKLSHG